MNRVLSTILVTLYLVVLLRPAAPLLEYGMNVDYIASELCENKDIPESTCNGKCYLNDQLAEAQNQNESEQKSTAPKSEIETPSLESLTALTLDFQRYVHSTNLFPINSSLMPGALLREVPTPPPETRC